VYVDLECHYRTLSCLLRLFEVGSREVFGRVVFVVYFCCGTVKVFGGS